MIDSLIDSLVAYFANKTAYELAWLGLGLAAQTLFFSRFLVQWIASERARKSVMPVAFWYFSLGGGVLLLAYAIHIFDPVFILGQSGGIVIYSRNLYFIHRHRSQVRGAEEDDGAAETTSNGEPTVSRSTD